MSKKLLPLSLFASLFLMLLLIFCAAVSKIPILSSILVLTVILYELWVPIEIIRYLNLSLKDFNIQAHGLESLLDLLVPPFRFTRPDYIGLKKELISFLLTSLILLIPYCFFYILFFKFYEHSSFLL